MVVYTLEESFAKWARDRLTEDANFVKKKKIIFSDEAHFDLGVFVNKQKEILTHTLKEICRSESTLKLTHTT